MEYNYKITQGNKIYHPNIQSILVATDSRDLFVVYPRYENGIKYFSRCDKNDFSEIKGLRICINLLEGIIHMLCCKVQLKAIAMENFEIDDNTGNAVWINIGFDPIT